MPVKKIKNKIQKNIKKDNLKINKKITKIVTSKLQSKKSKPVKKDAVKKPSKNMANKKPKKDAKKIVKKNTIKPAVKPVKVKDKDKISKPVKDKAIISRSNNNVKSVSGKSEKVSFKAGDYAVYPPHGVGKITAIDKTIIAGQEFKCYLMHFEREKLIIKIPVNQADKSGLRSLATKSQIDKVFSILRSGVKKLKGMWSRRAQEYETKINSGDIILLAEVLRDLARDIEDGERSYSERIIYETAIYRLAMEYSVVYMVDFEDAKQKVVATAKDKIGSFDQKDKEFDEFKIIDEDPDLLEELEHDEEEEIDDLEEDDDDIEYEEDDDDDDSPKTRKSGK